MNPMYGPMPPGSGYMGPKLGIGSYHASYSAAFPPGAPSYPQAVYASSGATYPTGFSPGTPYKMPPPASGAPPPYTPTPSHYQHPGMYPVRGGTYPPQGLYAQGAYFAQPVYAAAAAAAAAASQPHVIHHTTVVQPSSLHHHHHTTSSAAAAAAAAAAALYPPALPAPRPLPVLTGAAMAMTGTLLAAPPPGTVGGPGVAMPTYRPPGPPTYGYAAPHW
ncbi:myelin-associated neurite-outgrowth inhibitor-like isoform X2 [Petromyzon marinus]|uniref:myelin-associated neurite-outgrowth inhibitor-like isoform X2 n=1 Tax=Petromyzon marinus TaxID=7757 RepID=UPI003F70B971